MTAGGGGWGGGRGGQGWRETGGKRQGTGRGIREVKGAGWTIRASETLGAGGEWRLGHRGLPGDHRGVGAHRPRGSVRSEGANG